MQDLKSKIILNGIAHENEIIGCTEDEVLLIEEKILYKLPKIYKDFLYTFGHGVGKFYRGTDMFYGTIFEIQEWVLELLKKDDTICCLEKNYFVFSMHQGCHFNYFIIEDSILDPAVYSYSEGEKYPKKIYNSFSEFLEISVNHYLVYNQ